MKIRLNKELKIELLRAIQIGILDTNKIQNLVSQIANIDPFLELMKAATSQDIENQKVVWTKEDLDEVEETFQENYLSYKDEIYLSSDDPNHENFKQDK